MKNLFRYILLIVVMGLSSCKEDFLNLTPETFLSSASFFTNKAQFDQAVAGAYEPMRAVVRANIFMDEMRSDNTFFTRYGADRGMDLAVESLALFTDDANASTRPSSFSSLYTTDYVGVSRANTILSRLNSSSLSQPDKDDISGQALFLRAFYYYNLVQHFGKVPLQLKELASPDDAFKPRNSVDEVYAQIVTDLKAAIPLLPVATTFPQSGKASKGAAKMLLAYCYMSQPAKDYPAAEAELKDITNMSYDKLCKCI
jgi:hypothetical protein